MKTKILFALIAATPLTTTPSLGAANIPTINLSWSTTVTEVSQFKLYYSNSPDMANKQWHTECQLAIESPAGTGNFTMTCTNIPIQNFPSYLQVSAIRSDQAEELVSNIQKIPYSPINPTIINIMKN